jgi:hypothetical protein
LAQIQQELRGKNPELTVCQVRIAAAAVIRSWSLGSSAAQVQFQAAATQIAYYQQRNAAARRSHTKTTVRILHALAAC